MRDVWTEFFEIDDFRIGLQCVNKKDLPDPRYSTAKSPLGSWPCQQKSGEARCLLPALRQRKDVVGAAETGSEPDDG